MVIVNPATREMTGKIVFYGPGLCGKTTNLQFIYATLEEDQRGKMLTLATETDRTIFFDFLPVDLGMVRGYRVRIQVYTVPGQVFYRETRKRVLKGADGVVFVADSQRTMADANKKSFEELQVHLGDNGLDPGAIPLVLQYYKRDLADILSVEEMDRDLNPRNAPFFESVATEGIGVEDTLRAIMKLVLAELKKKMAQKPGRISAKFVTTSSRLEEIAASIKNGEPVPMEAVFGEAADEESGAGDSASLEEADPGETPSEPLAEIPPGEESEELFGEAGSGEDNPFAEEETEVEEALLEQSVGEGSPFSDGEPPLSLEADPQDPLLEGSSEEELLSVGAEEADDALLDVGSRTVLNMPEAPAAADEEGLSKAEPIPDGPPGEDLFQGAEAEEEEIREADAEPLDTSRFAEELADTGRFATPSPPEAEVGEAQADGGEEALAEEPLEDTGEAEDPPMEDPEEEPAEEGRPSFELSPGEPAALDLTVAGRRFRLHIHIEEL